MTLDQVKDLLSQWAEDQADAKLKRWASRRKKIVEQFAADVNAACNDCNTLADRLKIDKTDQEAMGTLLAMAAAQRGIVLPTPAALFPTDGATDATGRLAQGADGAPEANAGAGDGARGESSAPAGSVAGQPGGNGTSPQSGRRRPRHSA